MTDQIIEKIDQALTGKRFMIIGDHPHIGQKVRVLEYSAIKGCVYPGLLVINFRIGKERQTFRVFDLTRLISYPW